MVYNWSIPSAKIGLKPVTLEIAQLPSKCSLSAMSLN